MAALFSDDLVAYLDDVVPQRPAELQRMEASARDRNFPIIGPACGQCCYLLTRLAGARRVFEMGSGYGYSTAWFARGVRENGGGEVHHVVWDRELSQQARGHLAALGYTDLVRYHVGEAVEALRNAVGPFDIIFMDIDKEGYPSAVPVIEARLRPGGLLIADNILWHGQVLDSKDRHPETEAIRETTRLFTRSRDWVSTILPVRDGLLVSMRTAV